jgi:hypothetical protein
MDTKREPIAEWAAKPCRYAIKRGSLDLWHDCGREGIFERNGELYCEDHYYQLQAAER